MAQNNQPNLTGAALKPNPKRGGNYFQNKWARIKAMTGREWVDFILNNLIYFLFAIFIIYTIIYVRVVRNTGFLNGTTALYNLRDISQNMFIALGMGSILILVGADLSAGRTICFTAIFAAGLAQIKTPGNAMIFPNMGTWPFYFILPVVVLLGGVIGVANGFFVAKFKLNSFIVTLATQIILVALIMILCGSLWSRGVTIIDSAYKTAAGGEISLGGGNNLYFYTFYAIAAILLTWFLWNKTTFGKNMYAVGSNPGAAKVSGINVTKTIILVFMFAGLMYGFSGWIQGGIQSGGVGSKLGATEQGIDTFMLDALAACVVGGISLTGGIGKVRNIVIGVIVVQFISFGLGLLMIDQNIQMLIKGALILFAVAVDMRRYLTKR